MRTRRSLAMLMVVVMVVALGLAVLQEVRVWGPARRARENYMRMHEDLAKKYSRELADPPPVWPMSEELRQALLQLSAWHARRATELRRAGRFDREAERALDRKSSPIPDELIYEWLYEYHYPQRL